MANVSVTLMIEQHKSKSIFVLFVGNPTSSFANESFERPSILTILLVHFGFYLVIIISFVNHLLFGSKIVSKRNRTCYVPLYSLVERIYFRHGYRRMLSSIARPICSAPADTITILDRVTNDNGWTFEFLGTKSICINFGSYNYLGFAQNNGECAADSEQSLRKFGVASCCSRKELGTNLLHIQLEKITAQFLDVDDAIIFGMGFATNAFNLPALLLPRCLALSDELNHSSIILGLKLSGAFVKVYKHNNTKDLEKLIKQSIIDGQPNGQNWTKIFIITEGIFSMEGTMGKLPEIVAIKKKYGAYLYLDEAHSIGCLGPKGRGVTDYYGINPKNVDILMGTFSKSFASAGGYIAGSKKLINFLRVNSLCHCYGNSMSPAVAQQIISSMRQIMSSDGGRRIKQLARNTKYLRKRLGQIGVITYGHEDSPVIPILVYFYSKIRAVTESLTEKGIGVVGIAYPITKFSTALIRICVSAAHTKEQLDYFLTTFEEISSTLGLQYSSKSPNLQQVVY